MAKPRVFVSSTYYDLKHVRASLDGFIQSLGFDTILSEKGEIAFHPDIPLDESCYREAASCDIFMLIVGGRYGSIASSGETIQSGDEPAVHERYESVTKKEFESAQDRDIPTYVCVDRAVYAEYETYKRNRDNHETRYAHVDSVNIFRFLDTILAKKKNNPVHKFDKFTDIESWLREQWAGLFRDLLANRSARQELATLANQVDQLANVNDTLRRYLEQVVEKIGVEDAAGMIRDENQRLEKGKKQSKLQRLRLFDWLENRYSVDKDTVIELINASNDYKELAISLASKSAQCETEEDKLSLTKQIIDTFYSVDPVQQDIQHARLLLDRPQFVPLTKKIWEQIKDDTL